MEKINSLICSVSLDDCRLLQKDPTKFWQDAQSFGCFINGDQFVYSALKEDARKNLKSITIPASVNKIGTLTFWMAEKLESVTWETNGETKILEEKAFDFSQSLKHVELPEGLKVIPKNCFFFCKSLENVIIPSTVEKIEESAFKFCENLKSVYMPKNLKIIGKTAFSNCKNLQQVIFQENNSLQQIDQKAFEKCNKLKFIYLPKNVKIAIDSFENTTDIKFKESITKNFEL